MLDIQEGDELVVGATTYRIVGVGEWSGLGTTDAYTALATVSASTKRSPAAAGGKFGATATHLTGLKCTPLDPVSSELTQDGIAMAVERKQTFLADATDFVELLVEEVKGV